jgi:hypothetical protein
MKLQLPNVTLICVDSIDTKLASKVLDICQREIEFGAVKLIDANLTSLVMYSVWCLTELYKHIDTTHFLIVQRDGFVLNSQSFKMEWLELDYIAPLFVQMDIVGSGGFSLRSKRIMEYAAHILPKWNGTESHAKELQKILGYYEDGVICLKREFSHFKFATKEQASEFGQGGNRNPEYFNEKPFGFHRTHQDIDFITGRVDVESDNIHLKNSYESEINKLWFT